MFVFLSKTKIKIKLKNTIDKNKRIDIIKGNVLHIRGDAMKSTDVLNMMDAKYAMFGMFLAFNNRLQTAGDAFYEEITFKQFFLIACMSLFQKTAPTANELAKVMGCSRQNVKEILVSLEKKGLVSLVQSEEDKRKRLVILTEKAAQLSNKYKAKETEFLIRMYDGVSDEEIRNAYCFLSKLEGNLKLIIEENKK